MFLRIFILCLTLSPFSMIRASEIVSPEKCSEVIGSGGNYISKNNGKLSGKCQGNVIAPKVVNDAIVFSVPAEPEQFKLSSYFSTKKNKSDRVELTFANPKIVFGHEYQIDFKLKVLPDSDITNESFYLLQLWQAPQYSPIFGLRMKRGTNDRATFMIRNPENHIAGKNLVNVKLGGEWQNFRVNFKITKEMKGEILIYQNNKQILNWAGNMGYPEDRNDIDSKLRLKFGMYKFHEPHKKFNISFKDMRFIKVD